MIYPKLALAETHFICRLPSKNLSCSLRPIREAVLDGLGVSQPHIPCCVCSRNAVLDCISFTRTQALEPSTKMSGGRFGK